MVKKSKSLFSQIILVLLFSLMVFIKLQYFNYSEESSDDFHAREMLKFHMLRLDSSSLRLDINEAKNVLVESNFSCMNYQKNFEEYSVFYPDSKLFDLKEIEKDENCSKSISEYEKSYSYVEDKKDFAIKELIKFCDKYHGDEQPNSNESINETLEQFLKIINETSQLVEQRDAKFKKAYGACV